VSEKAREASFDCSASSSFGAISLIYTPPIGTNDVGVSFLRWPDKPDELINANRLEAFSDTPLGLRWSDIDVEKATIQVKRTVSYFQTEGGYIYGGNRAKTASSRRALLFLLCSRCTQTSFVSISRSPASSGEVGESRIGVLPSHRELL